MYRTTFDRVFDYYGKMTCSGKRIKAFAVVLDYEITDRRGRKERLLAASEKEAPSVFAEIVNSGLIARLDPKSETALSLETDEKYKKMYQGFGMSVCCRVLEYLVITSDKEDETRTSGIEIGEGETEAVPITKTQFQNAVKRALAEGDIAEEGRTEAYGAKIM